MFVTYTPIEFFVNDDYDRSSRVELPTSFNRDASRVSLSRRDISFGSELVDGETAIQNIKITNDGNETIPLNGIKVVGPFTATTTCSASLKEGESCEVSVTFKPTNEGAKTGGVYIDTGDSSGDEYVKLTGFGYKLSSLQSL